MKHFSIKAILLVIAVGFMFLNSCGKSSEPEKPSKIAVTSVTITQVSAELKVGETVQLTATVQPNNATNKTITWTSSNQSVATIANGLLTAVGEGTATITASAGGKLSTCRVTVSKRIIPVTSISLNKTSIELVEGESETLIATVKPDDATEKTITWASSTESIATVQGGKVTAVKEGEATITAKAGDKSIECSVKVTPKVIAVESIELNKYEITLKEGETETLVATVKPDNATDKTISWSTSDANIASIDLSGKITGIKVGSVTVTAKAGDKSANCNVSIKQNPANEIIHFADQNIKQDAIAAFDINGDGELSKGEAALVTTIDNVFNSTLYTSFEEFAYFTGVKSIPDRWFQGRGLLTAITLPESLISIGTYSFEGCSQLKSINIPPGLHSVNKWAFENCDGLNAVHISDFNAWLSISFETLASNPLYYAHRLILNGEEIKTVIIPSGSTEVKAAVFAGSEITSIEIPESVTTIGNMAFYGCENIQSITLPSGTTYLGESVFSNCKSLRSVSIPEKVKEIKSGTFYGCETMENITLPSSIQYIGRSAFMYCKKLKNIGLPAGISIINEAVFHSCESLTEIVIPESVTIIESSAFYGCKGMENLIIPERVTKINNSAFSGCISLEWIKVLPPSPPILNITALYNTGNCPIYVWPSCVEKYKSSDYWKYVASRIQAMPE